MYQSKFDKSLSEVAGAKHNSHNWADIVCYENLSSVHT